MTSITPIECYKIFHSIKAHFTTDYDYFKYSGGFRLPSPQKFEASRDHYSYVRLAKKYNAENYHDLVLSNILKKPDFYSREMLSDESRETLLEYQKRIQALPYNFREDIRRLLEVCEKENITMDDLLKVSDGGHPPLLNQYKWKVISLETLVILNDLLRFFGHWNRNIKDNIIWPKIHHKCVKYLPFIHYNKTEFMTILKKELNSEKV